MHNMSIPKPTHYDQKSPKKCRILPLPQCGEAQEWVISAVQQYVNQKPKTPKSPKSTVLITLSKHAWLSCSNGSDLRKGYVLDVPMREFEKREVVGTKVLQRP